MTNNKWQLRMQKAIIPLLILCAGITIIADLAQKNNAPSLEPVLKEASTKDKEMEGSKGMEGSHSEESHADDGHDHGPMDHSDPENQRRMGIFHYNEGNRFLSKGEAEQAIVNYKMALRHNENFSESYVNLSSAYLRLKQYDEAFNTLKALESRNPSHPYLYYNYACYYSLTGKLQESLKMLQTAIEKGLPGVAEIAGDEDLTAVRATPEFKRWYDALPTTT
ncbi:MAG: tetratricopeptide repeat protein [Candidatus Nitrohelix vancouverensis]|uniref:Tetratricopeptide repeat protein n=1 Tax=Candidatus Nitrohelix vancouverensis TaxID=2705534 RepID=A0A7T0G3V2_9BACT|nr:MAG: tetratricopeptide repeat protein [Candidatus Nitrohelix vancouverensis]